MENLDWSSSEICNYGTEECPLLRLSYRSHKLHTYLGEDSLAYESGSQSACDINNMEVLGIRRDEHNDLLHRI